MTLVRWKPRRLDHWRPRHEIDSWVRDWDRFLEGFFDFSPAANCDWCPAADVREEQDRYIVTVDLPGLSREDVEVTFENDVLTITGERKSEFEEKDSKHHRQERYFGKFTRSLRFPTNANREKIAASFKNGVLEISLPKAEEAKVRKIDVQ